MLSAVAGARRTERFVSETLSRGEIFLAQTPQAFKREVLSAALVAGQNGSEATDEAAPGGARRLPVQIVDGDANNIKVTQRPKTSPSPMRSHETADRSRHVRDAQVPATTSTVWSPGDP
jgi:hypothetical protein